MKFIALVIDSLREIYAKKVIIGIIVIEVIALAITGYVLFLPGSQRDYHEANITVPAAGDSVAAASEPRDTTAIDTALLGADEPLPVDSGATNRDLNHSSKIFQETPGRHAAQSSSTQNLTEKVNGQMGAFAGPVAAAAIFFGIFIMAGIVPALMEKGTIDLLLSKPISRTTILLGRALGGFVAIATNLLLLLLIVFILYGLASGVWIFSFVLYTFAISMFALLVIYGGIIFLNVTTEGSVLPMILAYLNMTIVGLTLSSRETTLYDVIDSQAVRSLIDGIYYALPQTVDLIKDIPTAIYSGSIDHTGPFIQGIIFSAVMYTLAAWRFKRKDF